MSFDKPEELIKLFSFEDNPQYVEVTPYNDRKVGFSVQRAYPSNIRYKPPKRNDGKPDTYALIGIVYVHPDETDKTIDQKRVPINVRISPFSRYLRRRFDYDYEDPDCPTEESVKESKKTPKPESLESYDEYFYDHQGGNFTDKDGNIVSAIEIIDHIYDLHCKTVHLIRGLTIRGKVTLKGRAVSICEKAINICTKTLTALFGRSIEIEDPVGYFHPIKREDIKLLNPDYVTFMGLHVSKRAALTFSVFHLLMYTIFYINEIESKYIAGIASNSLLLSCYSLFAIFIFHEVIPVDIIRVTINQFKRWQLAIMSLKFTVK